MSTAVLSPVPATRPCEFLPPISQKYSRSLLLRRVEEPIALARDPDRIASLPLILQLPIVRPARSAHTAPLLVCDHPAAVRYVAASATSPPAYRHPPIHA